MTATTDVQVAKGILADAMIGPDDLRAVFGPIDLVDQSRFVSVPFSVDELDQAKRAGDFLILRAPASDGRAITLLWLIERFPDDFDATALRQTGYLLRTEWGIALEPLAGTETCAPQWALVSREILEASRNQNRTEQVECLHRHAAQRQAEGRVRRRSAIEAAFDLIAVYRLRGERLLGHTWDWSSSRTIDGGYLNVGHFDEQGLQIFSFSEGIRHGELGVCPNVDPAA